MDHLSATSKAVVRCISSVVIVLTRSYVLFMATVSISPILEDLRSNQQKPTNQKLTRPRGPQ